MNMDVNIGLYNKASIDLIESRIKIEASNRDMTLRQISEKLGKTPSYLSVKFAQRKKVPYNTLVNIASLLGVPIARFLIEVGHPTTDQKINDIVKMCRENDQYCELCYSLTVLDKPVLVDALNTIIQLYG